MYAQAADSRKYQGACLLAAGAAVAEMRPVVEHVMSNQVLKTSLVEEHASCKRQLACSVHSAGTVKCSAARALPRVRLQS